jgi:hypothetical protein
VLQVRSLFGRIFLKKENNIFKISVQNTSGKDPITCKTGERAGGFLFTENKFV